MVLLHQSIHSYSTSGAMMGPPIYPQEQPPSTINHYKRKKESKLLAAQKHRMAEQSRRNRISSQYATLRAILPNLQKTDKNKFKKAYVLAETIRRVKELKKNVSDMKAANHEVMQCGLPSGADRLNIEHGDGANGGEAGTVKAVLSCDDRPEIVAELARAMTSVKVKVVRAEMVTVGGRSKFVLWMNGVEEGNSVVKRALEAVMRRPSWITRKPRSKS